MAWHAMVFHGPFRSGWIPSLSSLPGTVAREPWRLGLHDSDGGVANSDGLRALPTSGQFSVSQGPLEALCVSTIRNWKSPFFIGKYIIYKLGHFNSYVTNYQRVCYIMLCIAMLCLHMFTLWWTNILPWKITMFNGKIHYFYGHFQ